MNKKNPIINYPKHIVIDILFNKKGKIRKIKDLTHKLNLISNKKEIDIIKQGFAQGSGEFTWDNKKYIKTKDRTFYKNKHNSNGKELYRMIEYRLKDDKTHADNKGNQPT